MDDRDFRATFDGFEQNLHVQIGTAFRKFRRAPRLNDAAIRFQFQCFAGNISIPRCELSFDAAARLQPGFRSSHYVLLLKARLYKFVRALQR